MARCKAAAGKRQPDGKMGRWVFFVGEKSGQAWMCVQQGWCTVQQWTRFGYVLGRFLEGYTIVHWTCNKKIGGAFHSLFSDFESYSALVQYLQCCLGTCPSVAVRTDAKQYRENSTVLYCTARLKDILDAVGRGVIVHRPIQISGLHRLAHCCALRENRF